MTQNNGFIKIHRDILGWEWYGDINTKVLFIHLILTANYKEMKWRGHLIERGERAVSFSTLAKETGLSIKMVRTAISHLETTGEVARRKIPECTIISIKNYSKFQDVAQDGANETANEGQTRGKRGASEGHIEKERKERQEGKERKENNISPLSPKEKEDIFSNHKFSDPMKSTIEKWLDYKKERRENYKPTGLKSLLSAVENKLKEYPEQDVINLVEESMANNWQGIAWDRLSKKKNQQTESRWQTL